MVSVLGRGSARRRGLTTPEAGGFEAAARRTLVYLLHRKRV